MDAAAVLIVMALTSPIKRLSQRFCTRGDVIGPEGADGDDLRRESREDRFIIWKSHAARRSGG